MRTISFPTGTHRSTQTTVRQVLGALERRGVRTWSGTHVVREFGDYIATYDPKPPRQDAINYALRWLEKQGYGSRTLSNGGKRHIEFTVFDDVDLRVPEPEGWDGYGAAAKRAPAPGYDRRYGPVDRAQQNGTAVLVQDQPPLPFQTEVPTYRLAELVEHLERWAHTDRDAYADWVDQVLQQLRGVHR